MKNNLCKRTCLNRLTSIVIALFVTTLLSAQIPWDGTSEPWTQGDGTSENPYLIENGKHLAHLSNQVKQGNTYKDKHFKLTNNLNMGYKEGQKFSPIGLYDDFLNTTDPEQGQEQETIENSKCFLGVFDGNNKVIDNIHIYYIDESSVGGTGLFSCIRPNAVVKNLGIGENSLIEGGDLTGAIVGYMKGGTLQNCYNKGNVSVEVGIILGGLVGAGEKGKIQNCYNTGMIYGRTFAGGIIGMADYGFSVDNCYNNSMIVYLGFTAGGIVGYLSSGKVSNCYSATLFSGDDEVNGGILGTTDPGIITENCYYQEGDKIEDKNEGVTEKSLADMMSIDFVTALNGQQNPAPWVADTKLLNSGMPILAWQAESTTGLDEIAKDMDCDIKINGNVITVNYPSTEPSYLTVTDVTGKTIIKGKITSGSSVNINTTGIYIINVRAGGKHHTSRIIIK